MPRIDPLKLLICLSGLLAPNGGIRCSSDVKRITGLMGKFCKKLVSKCIYIQILKSTETELLGEFMAAGGWTLAYTWLSDGITTANWPLVQEILELMLLCPVDVGRLKINSAPKLVKQLSKDGGVEAVRILASKLVEQWLKIVKGETGAEMAAVAAGNASAGTPMEQSCGLANAAAAAAAATNDAQFASTNTTVVVSDSNDSNSNSNTPTTIPSQSQVLPSQSGVVGPSLLHQQSGQQHSFDTVEQEEEEGDGDDVDGEEDEQQQQLVEEQEEDGYDEDSSEMAETEADESETSKQQQQPAGLVFKITMKDGKQVLAKVDGQSPHKKLGTATLLLATPSSASTSKGLASSSEHIVGLTAPDGDRLNDNDDVEDEVDNNRADGGVFAVPAEPETVASDKEKSSSSAASKSERPKSSTSKSSSSSSSRDRDHRDSKDSAKSSKDRSSGSSGSSSKSSSSSLKRPSSSSSAHRSSSSSSSNHKSSSSGSRSSGGSGGDKDRHRSSTSSKSSTSTSASSRDRSRERSSQQAAKDKETLSKVLTTAGTALGKLGKIPKKPRDPSEPAAAPPIVKKPSISIEVRNRDAENRPKTVKTFHAKFRSHGLAEEAPPPPSRRGLQKPKATPSAPGTVIPSSTVALAAAASAGASLKSAAGQSASSPPRTDGDSLAKKPRLDLSVAANHVDKPGAIKLISPKPKPSLLMESDMFMDALSAATTTKKESLRKRKRRLSVCASANDFTATKVRRSSDEEVVAANVADAATELGSSSDVAKPEQQQQQQQQQSPIRSDEPVVEEPKPAAAPAAVAPMKFYQDTLESRRSTTPEPQPGDADASDMQVDPADEDSAREADVEMTPAAVDGNQVGADTEDVKPAEIAATSDDRKPASTTSTTESGPVSPAASTSSTSSDATPATTAAAAAAAKGPGPGCGPNGPPGVLLVHRRRGPKKQLRWRPAAELEEIRYFELDETERCNVTKTPTSFGDMKQNERSAERDGFAARKPGGEDTMCEQMAWSPFLFEVDEVMPHPGGAQSKERDVQAQRELTCLKALYFNRLMIPDSPAEPDFELQPLQPAAPIVIPVDDVMGNMDTFNDYSALGWPEPKGAAPSMGATGGGGGVGGVGAVGGVEKAGPPPPSMHHMQMQGGAGPMGAAAGMMMHDGQQQQQQQMGGPMQHMQQPPPMVGGGGGGGGMQGPPPQFGGGNGGPPPFGHNNNGFGPNGPPPHHMHPQQQQHPNQWPQNNNGMMMDGPPPGFQGGGGFQGGPPPHFGGPGGPPGPPGPPGFGGGPPPQFGPPNGFQNDHQHRGQPWMRGRGGGPGGPPPNWRGPPPPGGVGRPPWLNRTRLCKSFAKGFCRNGDACNFLHPGHNGPMC